MDEDIDVDGDGTPRKRAKRRPTEQDIYSIEAEEHYRQVEQEALEEEQREEALDQMIDWFHTQFEDPQNQTPFDNEDDQYIYVNGGPFDASEALTGQFSDTFSKRWIQDAVERLERDGPNEWAPTLEGDYYEPPDDDGHDISALAPQEADAETVERISQAESVSDALKRLAHLEELISRIPPAVWHFGHNQPEGDTPELPLNAGMREEIRAAIEEAKREIVAPQPEAQKIEASASQLKKASDLLLSWLKKKADLAVDEMIKTAIKSVPWWPIYYSLERAVASLQKIAHHLPAS